MGISASGIDTVAIFETTVGEGTAEANDIPPPLLPATLKAVTKSYVQVFAKLKE